MLGTGQQIWQKVVNEGPDTKSVLTQLPPPSRNHHSKHFVGWFPIKGFFSSLHPTKSSIENTKLSQRARALNNQDFGLKLAWMDCWQKPLHLSTPTLVNKLAVTETALSVAAFAVMVFDSD